MPPPFATAAFADVDEFVCRTSSGNSHSTGSTDSDEERDSFSDRSSGGAEMVTPGTTHSCDDAKMDIDVTDGTSASSQSLGEVFFKFDFDCLLQTTTCSDYQSCAVLSGSISGSSYLF